MEKYKGLTAKEIDIRRKQGLVNYDTTTCSKSVKQLLIENCFTLFNLINVILGIMVFLVGSYKNMLFLGVVICNTSISLIQELRAKRIIDRLSIIAKTEAKVIRNGKKELINNNNIVMDDIILFELGDQIITDSIILDGFCEVDESFITGESKTIFKKTGDMLLSGSFVVSGNVTAKVIHVALDNYTSKISLDAKKMKEQYSSEIMKSLKKIVKYISIFLIPIGILLFLRQFSIEGNTLRNAVVSVTSAIIGMIPEGLILLVSTVLALSSIKLSKSNILVQDLYSIETMARVDTLCLDKTGTITEGIMEVNDIIKLDSTNDEIDEVLEAISTNLNDNNPTFKAINNKYGNNSNIKTKDIIPFSSEKKYSGIKYDDSFYIMGAPEFIINDNKYIKEYEKLSEESRVLILVKAYGSKNLEDCKKVPMAFITIKDIIRKDASNIIKYFSENNVNLKIISGDNNKTILKIAKEIDFDIEGIVDLSKENISDYNELVRSNNIFTRVKPEQKRELIKAIKANNHVVAMTGDGVNDVLALKEADVSISFGSGTSAARNVSDLILLDSNFTNVPEIVKEGRKTINNVQRSATLFLSKTIYASLLAISFLFIKYLYPFEPIQMTLINTLTIGIPAFILALEPNYNIVSGKFLINVISKSIPSGITTVLNILLLVFLGKFFQIPGDQISTIAVIITAYTALLLIYRISKPLNYLRRLLLVFISMIFIIVLLTKFGTGFYSLSYLNANSILLLVLLMFTSSRIFIILSKLLNILIKRKRNWFV